MGKKKRLGEVDKLVETIVAGMQEKKALDIKTLNLKGLENAVCDYFVICHGSSDRQVNAIAKSVDKTVKEKLSEDPWHAEGFANSEWILLDYVNVVVHIFDAEKREFYNIERLWADADINLIEDRA